MMGLVTAVGSVKRGDQEKCRRSVGDLLVASNAMLHDLKLESLNRL